jgi:hypothetical protein
MKVGIEVAVRVGVEVGVFVEVGVGMFSVGEGDDIGVDEECGAAEGLIMF